MALKRKIFHLGEISVAPNSRAPERVKQDEKEGVCSKYEVRMYNQAVRDYLDAGEKNKTMWSDTWAEPHYEEIYAVTPEQAIDGIYHKFPEKAGFVITDLVELEDARDNLVPAKEKRKK